MKKRLTNIVIAMTLLASVIGWSQAEAALSDAAASRGGAFHVPGYGARAWGMGGAAIATLDDESAVYWNPSMMGNITRNVVGASYLQLVSGIDARQSQLAYVYAFQRDDRKQKERGISRHVVGVGYTNIYLDINGPETYSENHLLASYAYTPEDLVTFAISARMFFSTSGVDGFGGSGTSVSGAIRLKVSDSTILSVVARDAVSQYSYDDGLDDEIEPESILALATRALPFVTIEADVAVAHSDLVKTAFGAETIYLYGHLALRAGMTQHRSGQERTIPHLGFGLRGLDSRLTVHYSAALDDKTALGTTHRFSLSLTL